MSPAPDRFDIAFIGNACCDEVIAYQKARRMYHDAPEALKFAVALVSILMETRGLCFGTPAGLPARMR